MSDIESVKANRLPFRNSLLCTLTKSTLFIDQNFAYYLVVGITEDDGVEPAGD